MKTILEMKIILEMKTKIWCLKSPDMPENHILNNCIFKILRHVIDYPISSTLSIHASSSSSCSNVVSQSTEGFGTRLLL